MLGRNIMHQFPLKASFVRTLLSSLFCVKGQGRIDGAFCDHDDGDKLAWLRSVKEKGVTNIEMESLGFIALCHRARVRGTLVGHIPSPPIFSHHNSSPYLSSDIKNSILLYFLNERQTV